MRDYFKKYLKTKKLKNTKERNALIKILSETKKHFNAEDMLEMLKKKKIKTSRATLYRNLKLAENAGLIKETYVSKNTTYYETRFKDYFNHIHVVCIVCGKALEIKNKALVKKIQGICKENNFKEKDIVIEIKSKCKKEGKKNA